MSKLFFLICLILAGSVLCPAQEVTTMEATTTNDASIMVTDTAYNPQDEIFTVVEQEPEFVGGEKARIMYLAQNAQYPLEARINGIQGTVYVSFVIEKSGSVSNVRILRGIGGGCDEEVVRLVKAMPDWKPGMQGGKPVRVQYNMPVKFQIGTVKEE